MRAAYRWLALLLPVATVAAAACGGDDGDGGTAPPAEASTTAAPAPQGPVEIEILGGPDWLAADDEFVYVKRDNGGVDRIDPATGEVLASIGFEGRLCQGIGSGFGSIWVCAGADVLRLDFETGEVAATIPAGKSPEQGTFPEAAGRMWILTGDGSSLAGIDPAINELGEPIALGIRGVDAHAEGSTVWVASRVDNAVVAVDVASGAVTWRAEVPGALGFASAGDGDLWVAAGRQVTRVDGATGAVEGTLPLGPSLEGAIAADGSSLWIRSPDRFLERVDPATGEVVETFTADVASGGDVLVAFGAVWATAFDDATLVRIPVS